MKLYSLLQNLVHESLLRFSKHFYRLYMLKYQDVQIHLHIAF
nr:MAG TPA: hypothetical protein [Caudoviricetes sp.]